ncbi:MAG: VanW family protein [Flavobacteriaceae bacterium]|nr:VanW family protein [Flavobacteriaceae bacterium]
MIKKILPYYIKVRLNILKNKIVDFFNGKAFKYAKISDKKIHYIGNIEVNQKIKQTETSSAKLKNFEIAINKIEKIQINPNEIFSFWKTVGSPSKKNGFVESRSIVNGKITPTYGGGLCQLSGIIYHASLYANLDIIERYNHSSDIYTNETRFTPLGSDATVVYGFKDLKIKNNLKKPIKFSFSLKKNHLTIRINSEEIINNNNIEFIQSKNGKNEISTYLNGKFLTKSNYK